MHTLFIYLNENNNFKLQIAKWYIVPKYLGFCDLNSNECTLLQVIDVQILTFRIIIIIECFQGSSLTIK